MSLIRAACCASVKSELPTAQRYSDYYGATGSYPVRNWLAGQAYLKLRYPALLRNSWSRACLWISVAVQGQADALACGWN